MDIIKLIMQQLGVDEGQANGALGLVLKFAKENLPGDAFGKISNIIPNADSVIGKAPAPAAEGGGIVMSAVKGVLSAIGGTAAKNLGGLASIAGGLDSLGIGKDKLDDLLSTVVGFVKDKGGDAVGDIFKNVFKA